MAEEENNGAAHHFVRSPFLFLLTKLSHYRTLNRSKGIDKKQNRRRQMKKIQDYFLYFMFYSIIGWIYEVFLEVVVYRWGFSNRGVLTGPYCVVYGFGAVILLLTLSGLMKKKIPCGPVNITPVLVFIGIVAITTVIELIASYIMEFTMGGWQWDYTRFAFDFQGRIAPNPSIRFGIGGMIILYLLQPLARRFTERTSMKMQKTTALICLAVIVCDCIYLIVKNWL